jgi:cell fate (sporulation/competence/biofilm development) regulator YlbF (YheA/YmcA/DUF963 family)/16S rRNA G966 N2-methylase RsmD
MLWSAEYLERKGVERARLDAEYLLAHVLGVGRLEMYLQHERPLAPGELDAFRPLLRRRAAREPLQYILGRQPFRELDLEVGPGVLIPRPETEQLVEVVLGWARATRRADLTGLDLGTGSGAIALALLAEGPFATLVATDVSPEALAVARRNRDAQGLGERLQLRPGPYFEPVAPGERFDVVVSNPPYEADGDRAALARCARLGTRRPRRGPAHRGRCRHGARGPWLARGRGGGRAGTHRGRSRARLRGVQGGRGAPGPHGKGARRDGDVRARSSQLNEEVEPMAGIYDMARELGGALARTDEYQALKRAMDATSDDRELVELRNRIESLEASIETDLRAGKEPNDELKTAYADATEELQRLAAYQRLIAAQSNFEKIMYKVNRTVAEGIEEGARSRIIISS